MTNPSWIERSVYQFPWIPSCKIPLALKRSVAAHGFLNKICFNEGYLSGPKVCQSNLETPCIYIYTEGVEKIYIHFKQRKNHVITKLNSHKQKMMSTNHIRLLQLQQLLKMLTMGVSTLLSTLNYYLSNVCESVPSNCSTWHFKFIPELLPV